MHKTITMTVIITVGTFVLLAAAANRVNVNQILGSQTPGQVITVTTAGVAGWVTPASPTTVPSFADAEVPALVAGSTTSYTLAHTPIGTPLVIRNIPQVPGVDYTLTGNSLVFAVAPASTDYIAAWYRY